MNFVSWVLLGLILAWLLWAIKKAFQAKGSCCCGSKKCCGNCAACKKKMEH